MTNRTDTLPPPLGWAILDKGGIVTEWRVRLRAFFGGVLENAAPDSDHIARRDRESPGLAPHRVVAVYDEDAADTVRRLLAERDERIARMELLLSNCVESLAGYRREHGHEQACDAESAARKELEGQSNG